MANDARRYIMTCVTTQPSGNTNMTLGTVTFNLLESFSGTRDTPAGGYFSYNNITSATLGQMTEPEYTQRVADFLIYVNIWTTARRSELLSVSTFIEETCDE